MFLKIKVVKNIKSKCKFSDKYDHNISILFDG